MTFYDELGVRPDAPAGEIRRAYRNLARLLHPDRQSEEELRQLAEGRMRRLNHVYGTLSDPERRREYDLLARRARLPWAGPPRLWGRDLAWLLAGLVLATLYWHFSPLPVRPAAASNPPQKQTEALPGPVVPPTVRAVPRPNAPPASGAATRPERGRRSEAVPPSESAVPLAPAVPDRPAFAPVLATPAEQPPLMPPVSLPVPEARLAGTWIYVPSPDASSPGVCYRAEYVETVVEEHAGEIRGKYRARYRVTDRPISTQVAFGFVGQAQDGVASLAWRAADGSAGELKLALLSPNTLSLEWIAHSMGAQLGLASGSAVLVRRLNP